jgi:glycosyltransferase involved in cell wall biosynthesis
VDDAWLPALYSGAELYATASLSEGFGFTPLEAMSCGTPVVSSAAGSLPEVLRDAATVIKEYSIDSWSDEISRLLNDTTYRQERISVGQAWSARYTWEETAKKTLAAYRQILKS